MTSREKILHPNAKFPPLPANSVLPRFFADVKAKPNMDFKLSGNLKTILWALSEEDKARLFAGAHLYEHQCALGYHGDPDNCADEMEVDRDVARRIHEGFEVDSVCQALENRKSDAMLPEEPLSRRDVIDAAFMAHGIKE